VVGINGLWKPVVNFMTKFMPQRSLVKIILISTAFAQKPDVSGILIVIPHNTMLWISGITPVEFDTVIYQIQIESGNVNLMMKFFVPGQ